MWSITSVDRDDLADGGAAHFAAMIRAIRAAAPDTTIEVLTPDFLRKPGALEIVVEARPDVFNHNLETVPRLYPTHPARRALLPVAAPAGPGEAARPHHLHQVRPDGRAWARQRIEILQVMDDLRIADVDFLTIGQYLQPTVKHAAVDRFVTPDEFADYARLARGKGFLLVSATPLTRSCYHADARFRRAAAARARAAARRPPPDADARREADPALHARTAVRPGGRCRAATREFLPWCVGARVIAAAPRPSWSPT